MRTMAVVKHTVFWAVTLPHVDIYTDVSEKAIASTSIFFVVYAVRTPNLTKWEQCKSKYGHYEANNTHHNCIRTQYIM
jgi:hypothetical protein